MVRMGMAGVGDLLKEGTRNMQGLEEAVYRNIDACKQLASMTRTSIGPLGMNKIVVNHLEKLFVTNDSATIVKEMEVIHPAAKMLVYASEMQEQEVGDGTNLVIVLAGELLVQAEALLRMGLHASEVIAGYTKAGKKALDILDNLPTFNVDDVRDKTKVAAVLNPVLGAKQYGYESVLAPMVAEACIQVCPKNAKQFNVDNVRIAKIPGASVSDTSVVKGFVLVRDSEGTIKHVKKSKVVAFTAGIDVAQTETKGTVLVKNADELMNYNVSEEKKMEEIIQQISEAGVNVVISGSSISEMAMHFLERYKMMVIKINSKFDLRRACKAVGATPLVRVGKPLPEEVGTVDSVSVEEIGSTKVIVFRQEDGEKSGVSTVVIRGSTQNILDDLERAVDDGVNVYKTLARDPRFVAGAGAAEIEIAQQLQTYGESVPGLEQYAIKKYAEALEVVPRMLAENAGMSATDTLSSLYAAHAQGNPNVGVDIENLGTTDAMKAGVYDLVPTKHWGIVYATEAALTVLKVDQIIMAKPSGGPKAPKEGGMDQDD
mmetsp:Transcript_37056/g.60021  ORF Transcript_37056/g.60021 Transcript_37056/m.60021 type:complete len:544 (+) Transcript_37056:50-1681(+)